MATIAEQLTSLANTKTAIKDAIVAKGVAVADTDPFSVYAGKIAEIQAGGGAPATKFGASADTWIGDMDENGVLQPTTWTGALNFAGVKDVDEYALTHKFYKGSLSSLDMPDLVTINGQRGCQYMCYDSKITSLNLPKLTTINGPYCCQYMCYTASLLTLIDFPSLTSVNEDYACRSMFYSCSRLASAGLSGLTVIKGSSACYEMFRSCSALLSVNLSNLTTIEDTSACGYMFSRCENLTSIDVSNIKTIDGTYACEYMFDDTGLTTVVFPSLSTIKGSLACRGMFRNCKNLTRADFPALIEIDAANALGGTLANSIFGGCSGMTEIHFRADSQSLIESLTAYQYIFGATNATIYFDL